MQEAIQKASQLALSYKHQVIDIEHVLYVLLNDSSGIFPRVLSKLNKDKNHSFKYQNKGFNKSRHLKILMSIA